MRFNLIIPAVVVALLLLLGSVFVVREGQTALVLNLGRVARTDLAPGLHFKVPLIESARVFDRRFYAAEFSPERYLTSERKDVSVDFVAIGLISDVADFYRATGGQMDLASERLAPIIKDSLRNEINARTLQQLVSGDRSEIIARQLEGINEAAKTLGMRVIDIRLKQIDLPTDSDVIAQVYDRMRAERRQAAGAPGARSRPASSAPRPTASAPCWSPRPSATRRSCEARAMPKPPASTARPPAAIRRSTPSSAASRPTAPPSPTATG